MRFLADAGLSLVTVDFLIHLGHEAEHVRTLGCGLFKDPFGYTWTIATRTEDLSPEEIEARQAEAMKQFAGQEQPTHAE
jgi:hypothetical protein